jgi:hypothetical protein
MQCVPDGTCCVCLCPDSDRVINVCYVTHVLNNAYPVGASLLTVVKTVETVEVAGRVTVEFCDWT